MDQHKQAQHLSSVFKQLPAAVLVLDGEGRIRDANVAAHDLLAEHSNTHNLIGGLWRTVAGDNFVARADDGHEISTRNGQRVNISTCPLESGPGQIILIKDVTQSRSLQSSMARNERLASLGEMTASLAHQFRTPVASALLYANHLGSDELPAQTRQQFADKLISRLAHLEQLVQDMLVFARGGETRQPENLAIDEILCSALAAMDGRMQNSAIQIVHSVRKDGEHSAHVEGDRDSLITAIHNLLDNAVKACGEHGLVTLSSHVENGQVQIKIGDNGQGMDQATIDHVLEPFFTTSPGGTGLGLPVVNAVAQSHGGRLLIDSKLGMGSCFTLQLPLAKQQTETAKAVAAHATLIPGWISKHRPSSHQRPFLASVN